MSSTASPVDGSAVFRAAAIVFDGERNGGCEVDVKSLECSNKVMYVSATITTPGGSILSISWCGACQASRGELYQYYCRDVLGIWMDWNTYWSTPAYWAWVTALEVRMCEAWSAEIIGNPFFALRGVVDPSAVAPWRPGTPHNRARLPVTLVKVGADLLADAATFTVGATQWSPSTHARYHPRFQAMVRTVLLVATRQSSTANLSLPLRPSARRAKPVLPRLPTELWMAVLGQLTPRDWIPPAPLVPPAPPTPMGTGGLHGSDRYFARFSFTFI